MSKFIREHIKNLTPYEPIIPLEVLSDQLGISISDLVKLDANENPYGMPPKAKQRIANLKYGHIYPDPESRKLREKLSVAINIPANNLMMGAGADELIDLIVRLTMNPGDQIINCPPTFGFYSTVSQVNDVRIMSVQRNPDFSLDMKGINNAVNEGAKLLFLANPNNPDGSIIPPEILEQILNLPLLVVVDEAYIDFAPPGTSLMNKVIRTENLAVLRTFSKWGGLAGLRLGYGIFPEPLLKEMMKTKQPYNISVAGSEAGIGALEDLNILNQRLEWILEERNRLENEFHNIGWLLPYPTQANFILCKVIGTDAAQLKKDLANKGILVRYFRTPGLEDHIRFSIGKPEDTDRLLFALKELSR